MANASACMRVTLLGREFIVEAAPIYFARLKTVVE